jgi:hypothetical protein
LNPDAKHSFLGTVLRTKPHVSVVLPLFADKIRNTKICDQPAGFEMDEADVAVTHGRQLVARSANLIEVEFSRYQFLTEVL